MLDFQALEGAKLLKLHDPVKFRGRASYPDAAVVVVKVTVGA